MLGQVYSPTGRRYNLIILAGGAGSRLGVASEHIPKALTKIGTSRAISYLINRYAVVTDQLIVGTGYHADLLESYVSGTYLGEVYFSREHVQLMKGDGLSAIYCLDHADCRLGTIITYCDLLPLGNFELKLDSILVATKETRGIVGTFRNEPLVKDGIITDIFPKSEPVSIDDTLLGNGVLGTFVFNDTPLLKGLAYSKFARVIDLTRDIVLPYLRSKKVFAEYCDSVLEFGTETDLRRAREYWEGHEITHSAI
jgi:NDP-sugar pyrophosphorylase family protein